MTKGKWFYDNKKVRAVYKNASIPDFYAKLIATVENHDDGKAIAALPDLIEALQEIYALLEEHEPSWYLKRHYNHITQALTKAGVSHD